MNFLKLLHKGFIFNFETYIYLKSIFYKNDLRKSKAPTIPHFCPDFFVNNEKKINIFKAAGMLYLNSRCFFDTLQGVEAEFVISKMAYLVVNCNS